MVGIAGCSWIELERGRGWLRAPRGRMLRKIKLYSNLLTHSFLLIQIYTQLEEVPFEDLNEDQRRKVERKEDVLEEISRLTKRVRKEDFMYVCAEMERAVFIVNYCYV